MMTRNTARPLVAFVAAFAALLLAGAPANAHVGSPDVFYEGDAGPYHLFVTVKVPQVIPGVADIEIRSNSDDVRSISTTVARLTGPGSRYIPVPDAARRSAVDPRFFTSSLWLMEYGSLQVLLNVNGAKGAARMSVPVPSFARAVLPMPTWLGAILLALTIGLALGAISIVGAAAREAKLEPGAPVPQRSRTSGRIAMAVMAMIIGAVFYLAFAWWNADAAAYAAVTKFFKAPKLAVALDGTRLVARPVDQTWLKYEKVDELVPDHGHIVHLFLVRTPGLDRMWHLHPEVKNGEFVTELPSVDAGDYKVFADVVDKSGFPWTLVGTINLPAISGRPLVGDDSEGTAPAIESAPDSTTAALPDGTRVIWQRDSSSLKPNVPTFLKFEVEDASGKPAQDLVPYMGMAAHVEIVRDDLSVFAHIHPSGSIPMASLMMASADSSTSPMAGMEMAGEKVAPEISIPYGFPQAGRYRVFLQFKRAGKIETAVFDTEVK
jgi:hypothetical protein